MEVHAHPHTERKRFKHYLWEFLMLFLAVFLGFLAENQREHIVEHKRAKEYAKSLFTDLHNDTADINRAKLYETAANLMIDSLVKFVSDPNASHKTGQLYYYMRLASWFYTIDWSRATMNQLINSGNLRYFTNHELVTQISAYNTTSNIISTLEESINVNRSRAATYRDRILKAQYLLDFMKLTMDDVTTGKNSPFIDSLRNTELPLGNKDPDLLNSFVNALIATKSTRQSLKARDYPKAIKEATDIMELLKKEYHLK